MPHDAGVGVKFKETEAIILGNASLIEWSHLGSLKQFLVGSPELDVAWLVDDSVL